MEDTNNIQVSRKFKINKYLEIKLEYNRTIIYVNEKRFRQCKYLLLNIPKDKLEETDEINSIDEAAEILDKSLEKSSIFLAEITPETEFWGHCSNLQTWVENYYDSRLLHSNLAFPLLKALVEAGDQKAKKVFKEEIAERFARGTPNVKIYLFNNSYLEFLNQEELTCLFEDFDFTIFKKKYQGYTIHLLIKLALLQNKTLDRFIKKEFLGFIVEEKEHLRQISYFNFLSDVSKEIFYLFRDFLCLHIQRSPQYFISNKNVLQVMYDNLKKSKSNKRASEIKKLLLYIGPTSWKDWYRLGRDYQALNDNSNVIHCFTHAIHVFKGDDVDMAPLDSFYFGKMGDILIDCKEFNKANKIYEILIKKEPSNTCYLRKVCLILFEKKEYRERVRLLLKAHKINKDDIEILNLLADSYFHQNKIRKANRWFRKSWKSVPRNKLALFGLLRGYRKLGKHRKARELEKNNEYPEYIKFDLGSDNLIKENLRSFKLEENRYDLVYNNVEYQFDFKTTFDNVSFDTYLNEINLNYIDI